MKNIFLISLQTFLLHNLLAQIIPAPPHFEGIIPIWQKYIKASGTSDSFYLYITQNNDHIFQDSFIYSTYNILGDKYLQGHLTNKINYLSGSEAWSSPNLSLEWNNREYVGFKELDDNFMKILVFKEFKNTLPVIWVKSILGIHELNTTNGKKVYTFYSDTINNQFKILTLPVSTLKFSTSRLYPIENGLNYIVLDGFGGNINSYSLDYNLLAIDSVEYYMNAKYESIKSFSVTDASKNEIAILRQSQNDSMPVDSQETKIYFLNHHLNTIYENDITNLMPQGDYKNTLLKASTNLILVQSTYQHINTSEPVSDFIISLINRQGQLIRQLVLNSYFTLCGNLIDDKGDVIIAAVKRDSITNYLEIYRSTELGKIALFKRVKHIDTDYYYFPAQIYLTDDNNLLIDANHRNPKYGNPSLNFTAPSFKYLTMYSGKDLGLTTSIENNNSFVKAKIMPNPVLETITVQTEKKIHNIVIRALTGNICNIYFSKSFDVEHLISGIYFVQINYKDGKQEMLKFNKI